MKLREIERLRAVAFLMVLVWHSGPIGALFPDVAKTAWSGVELFFVISGYVVTLSLLRMLPPLEAEAGFVEAFARAKDTLRAFYARRFFRILPAALAVILLDRVLVVWDPPLFGTASDWADQTIAFFAGVYNYALSFHDYTVLVPYWSLSVEEHFYLLLPILFVVFRTTNKRLAAAAGLALFSIAARALPSPDVDYVANYQRFASHLRFDTLMAGVAMALVAGKTAPSAPIMPRGLMRWVVLPACIVLIATLPGVSAWTLLMHQGLVAFWVLSAILVGYAALDQGYVLAWPVVAPVLEFIGSRSYALYLIHEMMFGVENGVADAWPAYRAFIRPDVPYPWRQALVQLALAFVAAEILHRAVERPFMRLGKVFLDPEKRAAYRVPRRAKIGGAVAVAAVALFMVHHRLLLALGPPNLARGCDVTLSSQLVGKPDGRALVNGELESEYGAHTNMQDYPWMTIDLGKTTDIGSIRVYNRADGYEDQNFPLEIDYSDDGQHFTKVAERTSVFTQALPWRVRMYTPPTRYVRLKVAKKKTFFCLSEVEIFEGHWMARLP